MITVNHLREAWANALAEINAAILHLESGDGRDPACGSEDPDRASDAWLQNLRRDRTEYDKLLANFPFVKP